MSIEVHRHDQESYAFTIKRVKSPTTVTEQSYAEIIDLWRKMGYIKYLESEKDSKGVLHLHGVILLRRGFYRKKLCLEGFHVKLDLIYDETGWIRYIQKSREVNASDYSHLYLFDTSSCVV